MPDNNGQECHGGHGFAEILVSPFGATGTWRDDGDTTAGRTLGEIGGEGHSPLILSCDRHRVLGGDFRCSQKNKRAE